MRGSFTIKWSFDFIHVILSPPPPHTLTDLKASLSQSCIISELCLRSRFYQRNYIDKPESAEGEIPPVEIELLNGFLLME